MQHGIIRQWRNILLYKYPVYSVEIRINLPIDNALVKRKSFFEWKAVVGMELHGFPSIIKQRY